MIFQTYLYRFNVADNIMLTRVQAHHNQHMLTHISKYNRTRTLEILNMYSKNYICRRNYEQAIRMLAFTTLFYLPLNIGHMLPSQITTLHRITICQSLQRNS